MTTGDIHQDLLDRLAVVRRREDSVALLRGILLTASATIALGLLAAAAEAAFSMGVPARTAAVILPALTVAGLALRTILLPLLRLSGLLRGASPEAIAARVGRTFPDVRDHLVNLLQIRRDDEGTRLYSAPLIDAAFEQGRAEFAPLDFTAAVDAAEVRRWAVRAGLAAGVAALALLLFPSALIQASGRLAAFSTPFTTPQPFTFAIEPGNKEVIRGETVPVRIRLIGRQHPELILTSRPLGQRTADEQALRPGPDGAFHAEFSSMKTTTAYAARAGGIESEEYTLTVVERPVVTSLRLTLTFPSYSGIAPRELEEHAGDVTALRGTRVALRLEANKPLAAASLVFGDGGEQSLTVERTRATGALVVSRDATYRLLLRDAEGRTNADPITYAIRSVPDAVPTATILVPGADIDIAENSRLNLLIRIADDYGFSSLRLASRLAQSRFERPSADFTFSTIPIPPEVRTGGQIAHLWSLAGLALAPEDVVQYYVEVFDNDMVGGPKSGRSDTYTLRLPSLEEVFADVDRSHETSLEGMQTALEQAREARREMEELERTMRKETPRAGWEEQQKAGALSRQYEEIRQKLDAVASTIDRMVQEMQQHQLLSPETLEKYQELQKLMEELSTPEFAEAMKKLQQAMQQIDPEAMRRAMQELNFTEENFRKSLERTVNLLKRLQIEQKVDEAVRRAEEMQKRQENLGRETEQTGREDGAQLNELAARQEELRRDLEALQKELADLQEKMEEFPGEMPLEEMEAAMEELRRGEMDRQMQESARALQQGRPQQAGQQQRQASRGMESMTERLSAMRQALRQNQQQQIVNALRRAVQDLLELSRRQEELKNATRSLDPGSREFRERAQEQMEAMRDLGKVTENLGRVAQRSFGITPEMGKAIGDAMRQMDQAMRALEQRNGAQAGGNQEGAMASLNEAANMVQGAMNAMMQSGGQGMGMAGFMQRLGQMTGTQQGINQGTQNLGGSAGQRAAELGRLAGEQGMVRKSLEQLAREAASGGDLSRMLGDLNRIAQDMREVQTDLAQGNVNPETLRKQDRILSRLLDSQRSTRERDFERKRRAETGREVARVAPAPLDPHSREGRNRLQQDLLRAMEEGYARDYQELIRKYFEALERQQQAPQP